MMSESLKNILDLAGPVQSLSITPEAIVLRDALVAESQKIVAVDSQDAAEACRAFLKRLAHFRTTLESNRVAVKEPVLNLGRKIDAMAKEFGAAAEAEEKRVGGLLTTFAAEQVRLQREAEAEARRLQEAEVQKMREAERAQLALEAAEREARAMEAQAKSEAEKDAARQAQEQAMQQAVLAEQKMKGAGAAKGGN
jgi:hypothetical protein